MGKDENSEVEQLSKEQVWDVLTYVNNLYKDIKIKGIDLYGNTYFYNPETEKFNLKNLTNNPKVSSLEEIRNAQANYKSSDELLQEMSEFMKFWDSLYNKALRYYSSLLAWNWSYVCTNAEGKDYASKEYKEDKKKVLEFFNKFNLKSEGARIIKNCLVSDSYFTWFRKSNLGYTLQVMPQDRCKITGTSAVCRFLYDFDLSYFYNASVNIMNYDKSLLVAFNEFNNGDTIKAFVKTKNELKSTYIYNNWTRTKVSSGAWCWKFNDEDFNVVPPFTVVFKEIFDDDVIQRLQKNKDMLGSNFLLWGEMPLKKEGLTGAEKNAFKVAPAEMGQLLSLARKGVSKELKIIPLPLENTRTAQFQDGNSNMAQNLLKSTAGQISNAPEFIYSTEHMSQEAIKNALYLDYKWVANIYRQMEDFLNYFVNKETDHYKFKFTVGGSNLYWNRKDEQESFMKLLDKGILLNESKIASLWDMECQDLVASMEEMKNNGFVDKLQLLLNINTSQQANEPKPNGRPTTDDNDNTELSRDYS